MEHAALWLPLGSPDEHNPT